MGPSCEPGIGARTSLALGRSVSQAALTHDRWFVDSLDTHPLLPRERTDEKREPVWA